MTAVGVARPCDTSNDLEGSERDLRCAQRNVRSWRERAGRGISPDYTAMERSTSQSGGMLPFDWFFGTSNERQKRTISHCPAEAAIAYVLRITDRV